MKKILLIIAISIAVLVVSTWVIPFLIPWTGINVYHEEINVKTGQARYSHKIWYIKVSERVEDTFFSKVLAGKVVDVANIKPWHRVNTFSPGYRHSPHHTFHGAFVQIHRLESMLRESDDQRKQQIVCDILKLWQTKGSYFEANQYIMTLSEKMAEETE